MATGTNVGDRGVFRPDLILAWACDRSEDGGRQDGVRAGAAWKAALGAATRAAGTARRSDRDWRGEGGSWEST